MDQDKLMEMAEAMLDCGCGHGLGSHNSLGCYARTHPDVKCACRLDDDRSHADILAGRLGPLFERLAALEQENGSLENELADQLTARERLTATILRVEKFYKDVQDLPFYAESGTGFNILDEVDRDELLNDLRHAIDGTSHPRAARTVRRARHATRGK